MRASSGIDFYPPGTGIGHQIMVEKGYVLPGTFVVASDSHSNMYGALGAIGTPVVRTDAAAIWATGEFWWQIPRTVQVVLEGKLAPGATGKDVIVTLCGLYNREEVLNAAVEFAGPGVASLSMDARLSIANMSTEWGALVGLVPGRRGHAALIWKRAIVNCGRRESHAFREEKFAEWRANPPAPDTDAVYAGTNRARILAEVTPHVSGPDTVQVMQSVAEIAKKKVAIQKAYLVSCVNSRLEDLEAAAQGAARQESRDGGAVLSCCRQPLGAGGGGETRRLADVARRRCAAAAIGMWAVHRPGHGTAGSGRGRHLGHQSQFQRAHGLARCAVLSGKSRSGGGVGGRRLHLRAVEAQYREIDEALRRVCPRLRLRRKRSRSCPDFRSVRGRLVFLPQDNLNTDGIYGKDYTYREDMTPEMMARVVMENYDPQFAERTQAGDVIVGGFNFGTGSSREQAVTALKYKGIPLVIAGSFSQTYLRNAFNNGFLCIETPELVNRLRAKFADAVGAQGEDDHSRRRDRG